MSPRRLTHALIALLAVLGLSALPAASASTVPAPVSAPAFEDGEFIDEAELEDDPFEFDEEVPLNEDEDLEDGDFCDVFDEDQDFADEEDFDFSEETELGEAVGDDGELLDPEEGLDEDEFGEDADDFSDEELDDEICALEDGVVPDEVTTADVTKIQKTGILTAEMYASGKGVLDSTLTLGAAGGTARAAGLTILGRSHQRVGKAGKVTIRIKLTKKGRKVVRKANRTLSLTLGTKLALASGKTVKRTKTIKVKPKKKPVKGKRP